MLLTNLNIGSHEKSCIVKEVKIFLPCHQVLNLNLITFGSVFLTGSLSLSLKFIRCNRPPKLTLEDALEEVLQEMRDYHYI